MAEADGHCRALGQSFVPVSAQGLGRPWQRDLVGDTGIRLTFRCRAPVASDDAHSPSVPAVEQQPMPAQATETAMPPAVAMASVRLPPSLPAPASPPGPAPAAPARTAADLGGPEFADAQALALGRRAPERDSAAAAALAAMVPELQHLANRPDATTQGIAQYDLGYCYEFGVSVPADKLRAYVYYIRASVAPPDTSAAHALSAEVATAAPKAASDVQAELTQSDYTTAMALLEQGSP